MHVEWYGQSAFALTTPGAAVFVDPFGDMSAAAARGMRFEYPPIAGVGADLLLVTHEHIDHNGTDAIAPRPRRSCARRPGGRPFASMPAGYGAST
jgi:L-ascorbate metabolism protein UlaG (beta-lactamase superfamily)